MLNIRFLACTKVELGDLTVCIVVNGEKCLNIFQKRNYNQEKTRAVVARCNEDGEEAFTCEHGETQIKWIKLQKK